MRCEARMYGLHGRVPAVAAILWLMTGCAEMHQMKFNNIEPYCEANQGMCTRLCSSFPTSPECEMGMVRLAEEITRRGNTGSVDGAGLATLRSGLSRTCTSGIARACAADQNLGAFLDAKEGARQNVAAAADQLRKSADEERAKLEADQALVVAATEACGANPATCQTRCDKGETPFCVVAATRMRNAKPPNLAEARSYFQKACDGGMQAGCRAALDIEQQVQGADSRANELWEQVQQAGDDIAAKSHAVDWALRVSPTLQTQMAMARMRKVAAASVIEKYCPAKSEFITATSAAEFTKRAADHCANHAPTSNEGTVLTIQCRAAFAAGCPAATPRAMPPAEDPVNTSPAWRTVRDAGDRLAQNRHQIRVRVDVNPTPHNMQEAEAYRRYEPRMMGEAYCPAKKDFISQFSADEFRKRAAAHCQGDPPTDEGLSGAQVPLPQDCRDVFALSCP